MSAIEQLPDERLFGKSFDYTQWSGKNSHAALYRVPWSSDYRDIAYFPTAPELFAFLDKQPKLSRFDFSHLKYGQPVKFDVPFNEALKYNYLAVWNPGQPITSSAPDFARWVFYFVNDVIYDSPNSTRLVLQVDLVQTFLREVKFGSAYAEQGHVGIAERNVQVGSQGLLTQPDGLNLGADYVVAETKTQRIASAVHSQFNVMVVSNTNLEADAGTLAEPKLTAATGSDFENLPNGSNLYVFGSPAIFKDYLESMKDKAWVLQGIVSVTAIPGDIEPAGTPWPRVSLNGFDVMKPDKDSDYGVNVQRMWPGFKDELLDRLESRYRHLKKFGVYPYSFLEVSTYTGDALVLKPELWADDDARMVVKYHFAPPAPRIGVRPYNYNTEFPQSYIAGSDPDLTETGEGWNVATWIANFPQFSVVNSGYITTMAAQAHSIAQSYKDAGWQQNKALTGNSLAYDQATAGMNLANDLTQNSVSSMANQTALANQTTASKALLSGGSALVSGVRGGAAGLGVGALSALTTGIGATIDMNQQSQSSAMQQRLANQQNQAQVGNQGYVRDTNKNYADYATKGDYQNAVNSLNAKVEDAKLTQPTASGTTGGDAFILAVNGWNIRMKHKMVPKGARQTIGDYWLRYGYPINRFVTMPKNFQCMAVFTYWKLKETYVLSAQCPEPVKQALRGIFEKGVTVWHQPERMGENPATMDNEPFIGSYITNP